MRSGDTVDVSSYPADIQAAYEVFAVRCSRCHTLARPLNARITDSEHWVRYVTRMRRNPSSGINRKDAEIILRFLLYYTERVREEKEGSRAAPSAPPPAPSVISTELGPAPPQPEVSPAPAAAPPPPTSANPPAAPESSMTEPVSNPSEGATP